MNAAAEPRENPALNLGPQARLWIYIVTAVGSIFVAYGNAKGWGWLAEPELTAWSSVVALVNGLAAFNVTSKVPRKNGAKKAAARKQQPPPTR